MGSTGQTGGPTRYVIAKIHRKRVPVVRIDANLYTANFVSNVARHLSGARPEVQKKTYEMFKKINNMFGQPTEEATSNENEAAAAAKQEKKKNENHARL